MLKMNNNIQKIYPASSDEVLEMLNLKPSLEPGSVFHDEKIPSTEPKPAILNPEIKKAGNSQNHKEKFDSEVLFKNSTPTSGLKNLSKTILPYALVFFVGLVMYYFFFSNTSFNLNSLIKPKVREKVLPLTAKDTALMELQKHAETLKAYEVWISQYYFEITDPEIIDPNTDVSGNGLTNFQKFLLGLNPKVYDTLGRGNADSQSIALGINPLTGGELLAKQKEIIEKYFDLEIINNRLAVETLRRNGFVAGENVLNSENSNAYSGSVEVETARNGIKPVQRQTSQPAVSPVRGFDNPVNPVIAFGDLNLDTPGRLEVPSLGINVPILWTKNPKNFEKDLQLGTVHYPGTAVPGQIGTTYISGHSSNYVFARGNYNTVFSKLGDLPDNSSFIITVVQKNGKDARFHYVVTHRKEYSPTDQEQFKNSGESIVALSTCWPVGSTKSRLVVFGKLTQIEK